MGKSTKEVKKVRERGNDDGIYTDCKHKYNKKHHKYKILVLKIQKCPRFLYFAEN